MNTLKLSILSVTIILGSFAFSPAMAKESPQYGDNASLESTVPAPATTSSTPYNPSSAAIQSMSTSTQGGTDQSYAATQNHLPINNGLVFLLVAGVLIGIRVVAKNANKVQLPRF